MIRRIEETLKGAGVEYMIDGEYINILNSSSATRIHVYNYTSGTAGTFTAVEVQEFDGFGNQTYGKEFANIGKAFLNRVTRNIG